MTDAGGEERQTQHPRRADRKRSGRVNASAIEHHPHRGNVADAFIVGGSGHDQELVA